MGDGEQREWPNRGLEIFVVGIVLCVLSTSVLAWRIVYGIRTKRKFLLSDFLLIIAASLDITSAFIRWQIVKYGQGRHIADPTISKPNDLLDYSYYLWIIQITNLVGMAILKFAICVYLLALRFSRIYLGFVWASILMVLVFNLLFPIISVFCATPFEANWNKSIKGKCFLHWEGPGNSYMQATSNIVTDIVYIVSPILYLSTIQLSRRTQWGLRAVFCLGLVATFCSVMKATTLPALFKTQDPTWESTDLVIWSGTELSVGILIAALPPLRKQFEILFQKILPSTLLSSRLKTRSTGGNAIPLYDVVTHNTVGSRPTRVRSRSHSGHDDDAESERRILSMLETKGAIKKTVVHEIRSEDRNSLQLLDRAYDMYNEDTAWQRNCSLGKSEPRP